MIRGTPASETKIVEITDRSFNVAFNGPSGATVLYLGMNVSLDEAREISRRFEAEYVGNRRPDGKGLYQFTNPRVVLVPGDFT